jgi:hypothetical protein
LRRGGERLKRLVAGVESILFSEAIEAEGELVFARACEMGLGKIEITAPRPHLHD